MKRYIIRCHHCQNDPKGLTVAIRMNSPENAIKEALKLKRVTNHLSEHGLSKDNLFAIPREEWENSIKQ